MKCQAHGRQKGSNINAQIRRRLSFKKKILISHLRYSNTKQGLTKAGYKGGGQFAGDIMLDPFMRVQFLDNFHVR